MPTEKFLDISPPSKIAQEELRKVKSRKSPRFFRKKSFFIIFLLLIFGGILLYFRVQKVEIKIWPTTETIKLEREITFQENTVPNFASGLLPAVTLEIEKTESQKFPSSFVAQEKKAEGKIRVYNLYSTTPLTFIEQTRFLSDSGKLFRAPEKIVIPGKKLEGGKWLPGISEVKVIAAEPGEDYNIPASKFSLPGLSGTNLYTLVYGESLEPMVGGLSNGGHQLLAEDLKRAESVLAEKLKKTNIENLKQKADEDGRIFLEEMISHEIGETTSSEKVGSLVKEFEVRIQVKTKTLAFEKKSLEEFSKTFFSSQIPKDKTFWEKTLNINWQVKESGLEKRKVVLSLKIAGKISEEIEKSVLTDSLLSKSISEAMFLLKNQFEKVEIKATPFWLKRIPKESKKLELEFVID